MSRFKLGHRILRIEQLAQRHVLSAIPLGPNLVVAAAGEGEDATVEQQGQVVSVIGSDNDDTIELELGDAVHRLTVNGELTEYNVADVNEFIIRGDLGNDSVSLTGNGKKRECRAR